MCVCVCVCVLVLPFVCIEKDLRSLSSTDEKCEQKQKCCVYNFVQFIYIYIYIRYILIRAQKIVLCYRFLI